jgi:nitrogen regulatory protein P-II 1
MKEIKAIVRPNKMTQLRNALIETPGFPGMTISKAEGCSAPARLAKTSIKDELTDYSPKMRIEIVAPDDVAEVLMNKIIDICQTGQIGDGIVWITDVQKAAFIAKLN